MNAPSSQPAKPKKAQGFTLVETALAIGIVAFAMVSIIGLIPVGLGTYREAMNLSIEANIAQGLVAEVQRGEDPAGASAQKFFFDDQGLPVEEREAIFRAEVTPSATIDATDILSPEAVSAVRTVTVRISNTMNPGTSNAYPVVIMAKPE